MCFHNKRTHYARNLRLKPKKILWPLGYYLKNEIHNREEDVKRAVHEVIFVTVTS